FGVRAPDALEHDGEVRAALNGSRRARVLSNNAPEPAAAPVPVPDASEPTMTVDESALEPGEPGMAREIAEARERVQGEMRSTPRTPVGGVRVDRVSKARATPIPPPAPAPREVAPAPAPREAPPAVAPREALPEAEAAASRPAAARRTLPPPLPPSAGLP